MKITEFGFVSTPSTPSNCDCLHLVDAGRCSGRRPRLKSLLIAQTANANALWQPPLTRRFSSHWWVHGDEGLEWFSHHVSSGKFWAGGSSAVNPGDREEDGLWDLLALQQVETGHVLLQGPDTKTVAVLAVESPLLSVGCRGFPLLPPVLRGTQATPLWLVLWSQKKQKNSGVELAFTHMQLR